MFQYRIPLAWRNLTHRGGALAVASAGVGFAVVLMFMQTGFRNALFDSTVEIIRALDADIVVVSRASYSISSARRFPLARLHAAARTAGVRAATPIYLETYAAVLRRGKQNGRSRPKPYGRGRPIRAIGCDIRAMWFDRQGPQQHAHRLAERGTAIFDRRGKAAYGVDSTRLDGGEIIERELAGRRVKLVGAFELSTDFANEGNLLMSRESFAHFFPHRVRGGDPLSLVDIGAIRCDGSAEDVARRLNAQLPDDVLVFTKDDFVRREIRFWNHSTPIGMIFNVGVAMGFLVGGIICYQIIFTNLNSLMPEFATLKAMGYEASYFTTLVLFEAFYLSLFGYIPGLIFSVGLYQVLRASTGLLMMLTIPRALWVFALTLLMCVVSGALAMRKLQSADPASLF